MMYSILNKLFGWDYIAWSNTCDPGVARVYKEEEEGTAYYFRYRSAQVVDKITYKDQVIWLTCSYKKYMEEV